MLTRLGLSNVKSWQRIDAMRLAPITGLFGTNSSGKSTLLQVLLMLKQTAASTDRAEVLHFGDSRDPVSLGSFRDLVYGHDPALPLSWDLSWRMPAPLNIVDPETRRAVLSAEAMQLAVTLTGNGGEAPAVAALAYNLGGHRFGLQRVAGARSGYELTAEPDTFEFKRARGRPRTSLPPPIKCYGFPDEVRLAYRNAEFVADLALAFEQLCDRIFYLGPLREYPQRRYTWAGSQPRDVGPRGERVIDALLAARQRDLRVGRGYRRRRVPLEQLVAHQLSELGLVAGFEVSPEASGSDIYRAWVQVRAGGARALLTDVGFGVSQVLPVLVLCSYAPEGSILLLEQPEIHLHPSVQAGLADVLIAAVHHRRLQIIVESHSEHLLRRLQRRIAEGALAAEDAALYFCTAGAEGSALLGLQLDRFGNIANWPDGFFGDELGELVATRRAQLVRLAESAR
jgi:hypothetical protein